MNENADALRRRLRRLTLSIDSLSAAESDGHSDVETVLLQVAACLDALNNLNEAYRVLRGMSSGDLDRLAENDQNYRVALALVCARGAQTHQLVDFGVSYGFGEGPFGFGPFGGGWTWQEFTDSNPRFKVRSAWYEELVAGAPLIEPFRTALTWYETKLADH